MNPEDPESEREAVARTLAEVAENARGTDRARSSEEVLGAGIRANEPRETSPSAPPPAWNPPVPPDLKAVNESWNVGTRGGGLASLVKSSGSDAQVRFNSDQVQLDNALVSWTSEHFAATHRHYDRLIADMQQRLDDIDTRHRGLEKELVRHVHEMARRIDVVLGEGEKGRVSHEAALRSVRERLKELEEKLR
jgi:hypothetical protein